jgi:hypothetical protein
MIAIKTTIMMTRDQARKCVEQINSLAGEIGKLLLDLYEREGWKALGYKNWRECATDEFKQSQSRLYELLDAAKVERNISDMSEMPRLTKRVVDQLKDLPPGQQKEVYEAAAETAPNGKVTAVHVEKVKENILRREFGDGLSALEPLTDKEIVVKRFKQFLRRLSKEEPGITSGEAREYIVNSLPKKAASDTAPQQEEQYDPNKCRNDGRKIVAMINALPPDDFCFRNVLDDIQEAIDFARTSHAGQGS